MSSQVVSPDSHQRTTEAVEDEAILLQIGFRPRTAIAKAIGEHGERQDDGKRREYSAASG